MVNWVEDRNIDLQSWYDAPADAAYVFPASHYSDEVLSRLRGDEETGVQGTPLPWPSAHRKWAFRSHELTIWAGMNNSGKSAITGMLALDMAARGEKSCIASLEMKPAATLYRMTRQALGDNVPMRERVTAFHHGTDGLIWLFDRVGSVHWQRICGLGRYVAQQHGVKHLWVDSLMKLGIPPDDYAQQKQCVNELHALAHDTGLHVHLVHHVRKGNSADDVPDEAGVKGAGEIADLADNIVLVWRNRKKEREAEKDDPDRKILYQPDLQVRLAKQRNGDWDGKIGLYYHSQSMQAVENLHDVKDYLPYFTDDPIP